MKTGTSGAEKAHLVLASFGAAPPATITLEALAALSRCAVVFSTGDASAFASVARVLGRRPRRWDSAKAHRRIAAGASVGVLLSDRCSSPRGLDEFLDWTRAAGVSRRVPPAVSSADLALAALGLVLGHDIQGIQCLKLAASGRLGRWTASAPVLIRVNNAASPRARRLLVRTLTQIYPASHTLFLLSAGSASAKTARLAAPVLQEMALEAGASLYVPGLESAGDATVRGRGRSGDEA